MSAKKGMRDLVEQLESGAGSPWSTTPGSTGPWSGVATSRNAKPRSSTARKPKANSLTLKRVGDAVAELLSLPEDELSADKNKPFYISSFLITQRDRLESVQCVAGTTDADWEVPQRDIDELVRECNDRLKKGDRMAAIPKLYSSQFRQGHGGNYNHKVVNV